MPTLNDLIDALKRHGALKVASVTFGVFALVAVNCFHSTPGVDLGSNVVIGVLVALALAVPNKKE